VLKQATGIGAMLLQVTEVGPSTLRLLKHVRILQVQEPSIEKL
jgi:hypothetical protein